jgi:FixJ family two-component response regulator
MPEAKICIVDDDPSVLRSLQELLSSDDLEAEAFDDPEKFLEYVRTHAVRLAILDVWMPRQSGIELQEQLQRFSRRCAVRWPNRKPN